MDQLWKLMEACFEVYEKGTLDQMRKKLDTICQVFYPTCDKILKNNIYEYFSVIRKADFFEMCIKQNVKQLQKGNSLFNNFAIIKE